jgi:hypothetical protein
MASLKNVVLNQSPVQAKSKAEANPIASNTRIKNHRIVVPAKIELAAAVRQKPGQNWLICAHEGHGICQVSAES